MRRTRRLALSVAIVAATVTGPVVATGFTSSASATGDFCEQVGLNGSTLGPCTTWTLTPYFCLSGGTAVGPDVITYDACTPD